MTIDEVVQRLSAISAELDDEPDPLRREGLETEQEALREQARALFAAHPEGRVMLEQELASLERHLAELESRQIKKARISMGGGSPSGGGLDPGDVHFLRAVHERWNDVPALRARIRELRSRLE
jgi:hypothetical protein